MDTKIKVQKSPACQTRIRTRWHPGQTVQQRCQHGNGQHGRQRRNANANMSPCPINLDRASMESGPRSVHQQKQTKSAAADRKYAESCCLVPSTCQGGTITSPTTDTHENKRQQPRRRSEDALSVCYYYAPKFDVGNTAS